MTADREKELQDTILRLTAEKADLEAQVRALRRDLAHAAGDIVMKVEFDVSMCKRILCALNSKMKLIDDEDLEEEAPHGGKQRGQARSPR